MRTSLSILLIALALAACNSQAPNAAKPPASASRPSATSNGRRIFLTGRDIDGVRLRAARKPLRSSCAACHGQSGAGGLRITGDVVSADLRHRALVTGQKPPYTLNLLERAISQGIDNQDKPLDPVMPRWRMSSRDLHDVAQYVFTNLK